MNTTKLIRHLSNRQGNNAPSARTVATALGVSEDLVKKTVDSINKGGIFNISIRQGGGLLISGGLDSEKSIYQYVVQHVENWVSSSIYGHYGVSSLRTNPTYSKKLSGKWSTPDITLLCIHKFLHAPQNSIELATIEIKHAVKQFDVSCVYEALAHTRVSSYSVLFIYNDPTNTIIDRNDGVVLEEIKLECARLGIGLVVSEYPCDVNSWQYIIPAKKHEPDVRRADAFIEDAFNQEDKNWLTKTL